MNPGYSLPVNFSYSALVGVFTNQATTKKTANTVYQITLLAARVIDPFTAVVVEVDADGAGGGGYVVAAADTYTVDYLTGTITFNSDQGASALVRVSGKNIQSYVTAPEVLNATVTAMRDMLETTNKSSASGGYKTRTAGLRDATIDVEILSLPQTDMDPAGGVISLVSALVAGTPLYLEVHMDTSSDRYFAGWFVAAGLDERTDPTALYGATVKLIAYPVTGVGQTEQAVFGFVDRTL